MRVASPTDDGRRPRVADSRRVGGAAEERARPAAAAARRPGAKAGMAALTARRARRRLRRHRHEPALRAADGLRRRPPRRRARPQAGVYGVISLVFWSITIIVSIKYVTFIMRADNEGEGGIMALIALVQRGVRLEHRWAKARARRARDLRRVAVLRRRDDHAGDLGALGGRGPRGGGAVAGAASSSRSRSSILTVLFAIQRFGTGAVGRAFGPVMGDVVRGPGASSGLGKVVAAPRDPARALADLRDQLLRRPRPHRVHRARLGRARRHRAPRRCTPTWATSAAARSGARGSPSSSRR